MCSTINDRRACRAAFGAHIVVARADVCMARVSEGPGGKKFEKFGLPAKFFKFFPEYFDCGTNNNQTRLRTK